MKLRFTESSLISMQNFIDIDRELCETNCAQAFCFSCAPLTLTERQKQLVLYQHEEFSGSCRYNPVGKRSARKRLAACQRVFFFIFFYFNVFTFRLSVQQRLFPFMKKVLPLFQNQKPNLNCFKMTPNQLVSVWVNEPSCFCSPLSLAP